MEMKWPVTLLSYLFFDFLSPQEQRGATRFFWEERVMGGGRDRMKWACRD